MIQINPLKSYIDGGVRAAITTPPSASLVFDLPGKAIWVKGVKLKGTDHTYTFSHDNYITLTNTPDSNESEDIKIGVNTSALKNAIDTTYGVVSTTANGLAPKFTSGNKQAASAATTYYFLGWAGSTLKWYQAPFRNIRINSETTDRLGVNSTDPLIISSGNGISVTWDSTNKKIVITNTKPDVNHNTHYTTMLYIGENNDTKANKNVANPYLKLFDDNTRRATFQIKAGNGIAVVSDANGNITITNSSPDVNHNTDITVKQTPKTDNINRPIMMINGDTSTGEQINTSMFSTGIYANASTKMITANGFIKAGSSNNYVLLGGGGHKAESSLSVANADKVDGYHASAFATSGHNHNSSYVSSLTTSGNSLRWVKNGSNNDIIIPYATNAANITGGPIKTLADPGVSLLIKSYGLRSDYTSVGYPTEEYLKAWCKYAYANCSGKVAIGYVNSNSRGFIFADIYSSGINNSSGLPKHITGRYYPRGGNGIKFGTSYGTWYYGNTDTNTWRGIQDNLTSTSTADSLSANQGRLLANGSARDNTKLPLSGGTMTGVIASNVSSESYINANKGNAIINSKAAAGFNMLARMKSTNGVFIHGVYNNAYKFYYTSDTTINNGTNGTTAYLMSLGEDGYVMSSHLVPLNNATYTFGTSSNRWIRGYFSSALHIGAANSTVANAAANCSEFGAGYIELSHSTPFIDFHYNKGTGDYTSRIVATDASCLAITSNLYIGGQSNTDYRLRVAGQTCIDGVFSISNSSGSSIVTTIDRNGKIITNGSIYAEHFYENSDIRYKRILRNLSINSNTIANLPLFDFEWIENNTIGTGTSAQAVQQILPNIVSGTDKLTLDYGVLGTIAGITACKELVMQKSELQQLKEKVKQLEDKLRKYENI